MFESWDIRRWLMIALLVFVNVVICGCALLILAGKVNLFQ